MIQVGDLVRIMKGAHSDKIGLVILRPLPNVARAKVLDYHVDNDYVAYHTEVLEKL